MALKVYQPAIAGFKLKKQ